MSSITPLIVQATEPKITTTYEITSTYGYEVHTKTIRQEWNPNKYHEVKLTVHYQYWTLDGSIYTYQQWKFTVEFKMNRVKKNADNDVIQYYVGGRSIYFEQSKIYEDGDSITKSGTSCPGSSSVNNLYIKLYVCSRVRPRFGFYHTYHYKIWNDGLPGSPWHWDLRET